MSIKGKKTAAEWSKVFTSKEFEREYSYLKNDLGYTYEKEKTTFNVWAPTATQVLLHLYTKGSQIEEDSKKIESLCHDQWKLLRKNESCPTIMLVKRSVFGKNVIQGIHEILEDGKEDIGILAHHIMDYKFDSLSWNLPISSSNIEFISIPYVKFVVDAFKENDSDNI